MFRGWLFSRSPILSPGMFVHSRHIHPGHVHARHVGHVVFLFRLSFFGRGSFLSALGFALAHVHSTHVLHALALSDSTVS